MLDGVRSNDIIIGAYTDRSGGVCPMLAAHRAGGRTTCVSFPEAWDRFTGVYGHGFCRPATPSEIGVLRAEIEASLEPLPHASDLAEAIADHTAMVEGRRRREHLSGGFAVDLAGAIREHMSSARRRRGLEADEVGLDWLFEETLVLPDDFDRETEREADGDRGSAFAR